ncbi:hypothetical protein SAMN05421813_12741 [Daejeonella rubra]|uniref:Glycosyltransferase RgtA/B/C/D-like domain-containing protein n=2 Tax=Daejeonella rubra TaxID=990371 RepID=A0A1G9WWY0_9SPHI|nr:hypothetical protein SAMN05421813_12741 [Daejeonella rubra]
MHPLIGKSLQNRFSSELFLLSLFYLISHGGIFFIPDAVYWDDWVFFNQDPRVILETCRQVGAVFNFSGYLHLVMLSVGLWFYKYLTFFLMFASGILLNEILKTKSWITNEVRFTTTLLFLILPLNNARVCLINFPSILGYFMFFLAWYLLVNNRRILSLILFFFSFNIASLLMFYSIPIADLYMRSGFSRINLRSVFKFAIQKIDFIILPFAFFLIKILYFRPHGIYSGYNENLNLKGIWKMPVLQTLNLLDESIHINIVLFVILFLVTVYLLRNKLKFNIPVATIYLKYGAIISLLGVFPYWLLGNYPAFINWASRHQLLLPLGTSIIIIGLASLMNSQKRKLLLIIISISLSMNLSYYYQLYIDWMKQKELIALYKNEPLIKKSKLILFKDNTINKNAFERNYAFYEWSGQLKYSLNDDSRIGLSIQDTNLLKTTKPEKLIIANYNVQNFDANKPLKSVLVNIYEIKAENIQDRLRQLIHPRYILKTEAIDYQANFLDIFQTPFQQK